MTHGDTKCENMNLMFQTISFCNKHIGPVTKKLQKTQHAPNAILFWFVLLFRDFKFVVNDFL